MGTCLVTGASGYIGSVLTNQLLNENHQVIILIRQNSFTHSLPISHPNLIIKRFNNFSYDELAPTFAENSIDIVFHLAADSNYEHSYEDIESLIQANIVFGTYLLELMSEFGCGLFVNTASFFETGNSSEYNPQYLYAASKFGFQKIVDYYVSINKINAISLRLMDTYGPNDPRKKLWPLLIDLLKTSSSLDLSPGEQLVNLVHVYDVSKAFICSWELLKNASNCEHKLYYVANSQKTTLKEILDIFERAAHKKLKLNWGAKPYRTREIMNPFIGEILPNWQPTTSLEEGFLSLLELNKA